MSVLQKGVLTVVGATLVASALILVNEKTIAEAGSGNKDANISTAFDPKKVMKSNVSNKEKTSAELKLKGKNKVILSPPPIGPFQVASPTVMVEGMSLKGNSISKVPRAPQNTSFERKQPSFLAVPNLDVKAPLAPAREMMRLKAPEFSKTIPEKPQQLTKPKSQPMLRIEKKEAPINTHKQPLEPKLKNQKPSLNSPPVQRYMYVPMPVYKPQYMPQMEMPKVYYAEPNSSAKANKNQEKGKPSESIKIQKDEVIKK